MRPPELVEYMRKRLEHEAVDNAAYEKYLASAVADVVGRQANAGLAVVNDGEYPKSSWYRYVTERLDGLEFRAAPSERPSQHRRQEPISNAFGNFTPNTRAGSKPMPAAATGW